MAGLSNQMPHRWWMGTDSRYTCDREPYMHTITAHHTASPPP